MKNCFRLLSTIVLAALVLFSCEQPVDSPKKTGITGLTLGDGVALYPAFHPSISHYEASVRYTIKEVNLQVTTSHSQVVVEGTGVKALTPGVNLFTVSVTFRGETTHYVLEVTRSTTLTFTAVQAGFSDYLSHETALEFQGLRIFGPGADLAEDLEPEYVAVSGDSKTAWVTLQENNGIAKIDLTQGKVMSLHPLGFKDYGMAKLDPSDKDGGFNPETTVKNFPHLLGMYQPDGVAWFSASGEEYVITANEGDAREWGTFVEESRGKELAWGGTFGDATAIAALKSDGQLGRLTVTKYPFGPSVPGTFNDLYTFGARSVTIWKASDLTQIWDSGTQLDEAVKAAGDGFSQ